MSETLTVTIELQVNLSTDWKELQDANDAVEEYEKLIGLKAEQAFQVQDGIEVMNVYAIADTDDHLDEWEEQEALERRQEEMELRKTKGEVG